MTATKTKPSTFGDTPAAGDHSKLWQDQIIDQLAALDPADFTHVLIKRDGETATLLSTLTGTDGIELDQGEEIIAADVLHAHIDAQKLNEVEVSPEQDGSTDPIQPDPEGRKLFDPAQFDSPALRLAPIDGEDIQKIAAKFGGAIWLDRASEQHVHLIRDLKLGQTITLMVEATVGPPVPSSTTNREGDLDVLSLSRKFVVTHVYAPSPEEL